MAPVEISLINLTIGVIFATISSILFASGIILQKKAVVDMPEIKLSDVSSMTAMVKNKTWVIGILIAMAGGPFYLLTQVFIGVTLTQPIISGLQLAFTVILAMFLLDEKIGKIETLGFCLLVISPIFLTLGNVTAPAVDLMSSEFYFSFFLLFLLPILLLCAILFLMTKKANEVMAGIIYAMISGMIFAIGAIMAQFGVEVLKGYSQLIMLALLFFIFLMLGNTLATIIQQLAFQRGKVGISIGFQATVGLLLAIYGGILIFNQLILAPFFFITGIIMIFAGNALLVQFQTRIEEIETKKPVIDRTESNST